MIRPIVFAAGLGTRMGAIKALVPIDGTPALAVVLNTIALSDLQSPLVVLGHDAKEIQANVDLAACQVVINDHPESGLSSSMKLALGSLDAASTGILTFHVDMPYLTVSTVRALLDAVAEGATLAAPFHDCKRGFPVYFHRRWIGDLSASLEGDRGGRRFLAQHAEQLISVSVDDPGCIFDIDRPSDLMSCKGVRLCATNE